jgi:hypothetical protein
LASATHTHPDDTPPSLADVRLASYLEIPFSALLPDGQELTITPREGLTEQEAVDLAKAVNDEVASVFRPGLDTTSAARPRQEAFLQTADALGLIECSGPLEGLNGTERTEIEAIVERALGNRPFDAVADGASSVGEGGGRTGPDGVGPETQAAGTDAVYPDFLKAFKEGVPTDVLIERPEFVNAVGRTMTKSPTSKKPGFDTEAWYQNREYTIDGSKVDRPSFK